MKRRLTITLEYEGWNAPAAINLLPQLQGEAVKILLDVHGGREPNDYRLAALGVDCVIHGELSPGDSSQHSEGR
jgi:hypothetical protein